jgi:hypothetical protein
MSALLLGWSGVALAQDATVYELTENMKLVSKGQPRRTATSEIMGFVKPDTAMCPAYLAQPVAGRGNVCTINVTGSDSLSLATGLGMLRGRFTVVVQGDNPVDSPEYVVMRGNFRGKMDFSPALVGPVDLRLPYGTVTGTFTSDAGERIQFTGVFYLPFVIPGDPSGTAYYLDFVSGVVPVADNEKALGYPTVKFEINFE